MPINSKHPNYDIKKSTRCTDAYNGEVLDYIPKLTRQNNEQYEAYRQRGVYFNVTKRTTEAMVGAALRKPFVTDVEDVQVDGDQSLAELVSDILRGLIVKSRVGLLVDYKDEAKSPNICMYPHGNIINWRDDRSLVVLEEVIHVEDPKDPYELHEEIQYRELFIDPETGNYTVRIWCGEGGASKKVYRVKDTWVPTRRGEPLKKIPFFFVTPFDTTTNIYDPVVYNLAQVNIGHFKNIVDLEHGSHFTALPTPWYAGEFNEDMEGQVALGGDHFIGLEKDSSIGFLEFTGSGLKAIEERRANKEEQMAALGSQLMVSKAGVESAEALRIRAGSESAALVNIVTAAESAMRQALSVYVWWDSAGDMQEAQFEMSRDFTAANLTPQQMQALMQLYLAGTISQETYLENLFEGEITQDVELEMERLGDIKVTTKQNWIELIETGIASRVDYYMAEYGMTEDEARKKVAQVDKDNSINLDVGEDDE